MATGSFNTGNKMFTNRNRGMGNLFGMSGGGFNPNILASVLGIVGVKQFAQWNRQNQRLQREEQKKHWHLSTQMHKDQKKIYNEQIKIFEDLAKAVGSTVSELKNLPYDKLVKAAKYLGIEKTGLITADIELNLQRKGADPKSIVNFDDALKEINEVLEGMGLQKYETRAVPSRDILKEILNDPLEKIDFSILNPSSSEKGAIHHSSIRAMMDIADKIEKNSSFLNTFKSTGVIDKNVQKIIDPMINLLKHFGKGQDEIDKFIKHFLYHVEDLVSITNDEFKELYEQLGGKTFLMSDKDKIDFENNLKKYVASGLTDQKVAKKLIRAMNKIDKTEKSTIGALKKTLKAEGFSSGVIKKILTVLKVDRRITETDINNLRKDLAEKLKIVESGGELTESEKDFYSRKKLKTLNKIYDEITQKTTSFIDSFGQMAIPLKATIGFIAHSLHQVFTTIEQISETTGRFSKTLWGEFDTLKDEMDAIFYNRDFYAFKSNERILKISTELFRTQYSLFEQLGRSYAKTDASTLNKVALWQDVVSMTGDEVGSMLRVFRDIGNDGMEENLEYMTKIATFADSAGISTKQLFQEIGENSALYARNMGTSVTEMVKLNTQLIRVGLSMKDIERVMSGFDSVESMLEKSMKLSIFTGKNINFMAMTTAKMMGDLPRATEELRTQLNKFSDQEWFSAGFAFQKMQIAKELGMTEDELNKIRKGLTQAEKEAEMVQQKLNQSFKESSQKFYESFRQIGLSKLKQYFEHYIINPLTDLFITYKDETKAIIDLIGTFMKYFGEFVVDLVRVVGGSLKWFLEATGINMTVDGERVKPNQKNSEKSNFNIWGESFGLRAQKTEEGVKEPKKRSFAEAAKNVALGALAIGTGIYVKNKIWGSKDEVKWLKKIYYAILGRDALGNISTISRGKRINKVLGNVGARFSIIKDAILGKNGYGTKKMNPLEWSKTARIGGGIVSAVALGNQFVSSYSEAFEGAVKTSWSSKITSIVSGGALGFMIGGPIGALIGGIIGVVGNEISHSVGKVNGQLKKIMDENPLMSEQDAFQKAREQIRKDNTLFIDESSNEIQKTWRAMLSGLDEITMWFKKPKSESSLKPTGYGYGVNTSHFTGLADGGIVTRATKAIIGEGKDNEAVIPLTSSRGRQLLKLDLSNESISNLTSAMIKSQHNQTNIKVDIDAEKINLSDESITKLALAIQKAQINVKVNVDNKGKIRLSRDEKELNYYKNSQSGLLDIETY